MNKLGVQLLTLSSDLGQKDKTLLLYQNSLVFLSINQGLLSQLALFLLYYPKGIKKKFLNVSMEESTFCNICLKV